MRTNIPEFHKSFCQTKELIHSCEKISSFCNASDRLENPFFIDEDYKDFSEFPWLYYATTKTGIVGFLSIYIIDAYNVEICGFVLPQYRGNKIASNLFSRMVMDFSSRSFQLSMDINNTAGKAFVHQMGFEYCSTECSMKLNKKDFSAFHDAAALTGEKHENKIIITGLTDGKETGHAIISVFDDTVCIHDVEILEEYRGRGYGYQLMGTLLNHVFEKYNMAILHVTKENVPAYSLYTKLGFQPEQELAYYEL